MKLYQTGFVVLIVTVFTFGCSSEPDQMQVPVSGQMTVDSSLDSSQDYSGIELLIAFQTAEGALQDTVFYATTDEEGNYSGVATIDERDIFPIIISRNGNTFGVVNAVLAEGDTLELSAELPDVSSTYTLSSYENDAFLTYNRLERNFNRVALFINAGAIGSDSVEVELQKWSDLYWTFYNDREGTMAATNAASSSLSLLQGWNDALMMQRMDSLIAKNKSIPNSVRQLGIQYRAETGGLDAAISFIDSLQSLTDSPQERMNITMNKVELLFDSARTDRVNELLEQFKRDYQSNETAIEWANNVEYDLDVLAPGQTFPDFQLQTTAGSIVSNEALENTPYLIEITRLDNPLYQEQFERTVAIYQIYRSFGLRILTVPISSSETTVNAFFQERAKLWDVIQPGTFSVDEFLELYNINQVPTRFLVNDKGEIIRRYEGTEYDEIVRGLQQIITQQETGS
ncbi:MAG: hypothetical protein WD381_07520 [Balneolaceae bacterium]